MHTRPGLLCNTGHTLRLSLKMDNISELPKIIRINYLADLFRTCHQNKGFLLVSTTLTVSNKISLKKREKSHHKARLKILLSRQVEPARRVSSALLVH